MKEAGATVELFNLASMKIEPCRECTEDMFFFSNGKCKCKDDMQKLYPKFRDADIWVLASPNYCNKKEFGLKTLLDRMEPLFQTELEPVNNGSAKGKIAFVSTCEQYELENFKILIDQMKNTGRMFARDYAGSLLRPHSGVMNAFIQMGDIPSDVFSAAKKAGKQLVKKGSIPQGVQKKVSRKLISKKSFIQKVNNSIDNN